MDDATRAKKLYEQAKKIAKQGGSDSTVFRKCLELVKKAYELDPRGKYAKKIRELEEVLDEGSSTDESGNDDDDENNSNLSDEDDDHDGLVRSMKALIVNPNMSRSISHSVKDKYVTDVEGHLVRTDVFKKLYDYQVEALKWLFDLFNQTRDNGCILADDMGLGKTVMSITFVSTLIENDHINHVLIVAPNTLLQNWAREFHDWYPDIEIRSYNESTPRKREKNLRFVQMGGGILFTTYSLLHNHKDYFSHNADGTDFVWDVVILDEAHKIKNSTKTTKAAAAIPSLFRLALTGTPIENNLRELWAIYEWTHKGGLLGSYHSFKHHYELPIERARKKGVSGEEIETGKRLAADLRQRYQRYFLRRTKDEVLNRLNRGSGNAPAKLPPKYDFVIWIKLTETQVSAYKAYLNLEEFQEVMRSSTIAGAFVKLDLLRKVCQSLNLIPYSQISKICQNYQIRTRKKKKQQLNLNTSALMCEDDLVDVNDVDIDDLLDHAAKLQFLIHLLGRLRQEGHRTLVFSQSTRVLDMIQRVLLENDFILARLDGRVRQRDRDQYINAFQTSTEVHVMLLTTGVGGVGLTLTNANRVVIYDPSWNPGIDAQAIDRAYRIGQTKPVVVYRLITCSTVEEKMFRRQVFKRSLFRQMVQSEEDPQRYFSHQDLKELFNFNDPTTCETYHQIEDLHGVLNVNCPKVRSHVEQHVKSHPLVYDVTDYNVLFTLDEDEVLNVNEAAIDRFVAISGNVLDQEVRKRQEEAADKFKKDWSLHVKDSTGNKVDKEIEYVPLRNPSDITTQPKHKFFADTPQEIDLISPIASPKVETRQSIVDLSDSSNYGTPQVVICDVSSESSEEDTSKSLSSKALEAIVHSDESDGSNLSSGEDLDREDEEEAIEHLTFLASQDDIPEGLLIDHDDDDGQVDVISDDSSGSVL